MADAFRWSLLALVLVGAGVAAVFAGQPVVFLLVAMGVVGYVLARLRRRPAGTPDAVPPVPLPPEETELEEGPVSACMRCGYPRVRTATLREGGIPGGGAGLDTICPRCRHRGPALEFDDVTAYRQFIKGLHATDAPEETPPR